MRRCFALCALCALLFAATTVAADEYASVRDKLATCVPCHGDKGASKIPLNPILAGQHLHYTYTQLKDFKSGFRKNAIMQPMAQLLEKEDMLLIARYFSEQKWPKGSSVADARQTATGQKVVTGGQCIQCHLGQFEGASGVPRVAGQHPAYIEKTLFDFKNKVRTNSPAKNSLIKTFSDDDIKAVSAYITALSP